MKRLFMLIPWLMILQMSGVLGTIQLEPLSSPFKTREGEEIVVMLTESRSPMFIPVTIQNGKALDYKKGLWGKGYQLEVDAKDFPALAETGLHSETELACTKAITGRSVAEITESGRPGRLSMAGFMAESEDILSVLRGDNRMVSKLGLTHPQLARPLFHVWNMILKDHELNKLGRFWNSCILYNRGNVFIKAEGSKGWQESLFDDEILGSFQIEIWREMEAGEKAFLDDKYPELNETQMTELLNRLSSVHTGEMVPYYIMRYGFYEGHTDYRADPLAIAYIFGLKSLREIESAFPGKLYETLTSYDKMGTDKLGTGYHFTNFHRLIGI